MPPTDTPDDPPTDWKQRGRRCGTYRVGGTPYRTAREQAKLFGFTPREVSDMENGRADPTPLEKAIFAPPTDTPDAVALIPKDDMIPKSEVIARMWEVDPHGFSSRPCSTCQHITEILSRPFGCVKAANEKRRREQIEVIVNYQGAKK